MRNPGRDHGAGRRRLTVASVGLLAAGLACGGGVPIQPTPGPIAPGESVFDGERTAYGFFPSPPEATYESILATFEAIGEHADVVLIQPNIPWQDFLEGPQADSPAIIDLRNQLSLARQQGLEAIFVVDPLNGLNRREFFGLPASLEGADFSWPEVRLAYRSFTLRILREFAPRYLGLASEINTYADAHPQDFPNFISLYRETYAAIKDEAPATQVFVTFQWEDLNNLLPGATEGRTAFDINWEQVEVFEPELDAWIISSYPFAAFPSGADIPPEYYTPLLSRTVRPLAVAEGGYTSTPVGPLQGTPEDQVAYLEAIHEQLGARLRFWIYLLLSDFDIDSYARAMRQSGSGQADIDTLGLFTAVGLRESDGTPKPALAVWDRHRSP